MIEAKPENLIGDRAYDSDPLDEELRKDGIEMIAPHRSNRSKPPGSVSPKHITLSQARRSPSATGAHPKLIPTRSNAGRARCTERPCRNQRFCRWPSVRRAEAPLFIAMRATDPL